MGGVMQMNGGKITERFITNWFGGCATGFGTDSKKPQRLRERELLFWGELHFHQFARLVRGGFPSPTADGVGSSLRQHGMAASDCDVFHAAIGGDHGFDPDHSLQRHFAGEGRVRGRAALNDATMRRFLCERERG